jgi:hypothetical protein
MTAHRPAHMGARCQSEVSERNVGLRALEAGRPIERLELGEGPLVCRVRWMKQRMVYVHVIVGAVVLLRLHHEEMALASPCVRRRRLTCGMASGQAVSVLIG